MLLAIAAMFPAVLLAAGVFYSFVRPRDEDRPAHIESGRSHMRSPKEQR